MSPTSSTTHASPSQLGARGWKSAATAASSHAGSTQSSRGGRAAAAIGRGMQCAWIASESKAAVRKSGSSSAAPG